MWKKHILYYILILFLLADLGYSFAQHLSQPLDGDMPNNIVPGNDVKPILESPLGFATLIKHKSYLGPNRFFAHYPMKKYFEVIPLYLQKFMSPIDSIYLSCAIAKTLIQLTLIFLLAFAITGNVSFRKPDFLIAAALVTPLFQTEGYQSYMGIIDNAPTYAFFYALPVTVLLIYFFPLILQYFHERKPAAQTLIYILWIPLALVVSLSGPLNPGIVLIFSLLLCSSGIIRNYFRSDQPGFLKKISISILRIPYKYWFYLLPVCFFSLYSLYIGSYNANNIKIPLSELYSRLPAGIFNPLTKKLGFPVLLLVLALNQILISKYFKTSEGKKITNIFKWIGIFALVYILLLPIGGYREYRPNVLRYDTLLPVTLCLIFMFGITAFFLVKNLSVRHKKWYIPLIIGILLFYTINDEQHFDKNKCERLALKEISESKSDTILLKDDCLVLSWGKIKKPEDSRLISDLLCKWNVTKVRKFYYNGE